MKRIAAVLLVLLGSLAWAEGPVLTSVHAVRALSVAEAGRGLPVDFRGTVVFYSRSAGTDLFVQEGGAAVYVYTRPGLDLVAGDRVRVRGRTDADFSPDVIAGEVTLLGHGAPPPPVTASFGQLIRGELDCRRVRLRAQVRSAERVVAQGERVLYLSLRTPEGPVDAMVAGDGETPVPASLLDAEVEVTGAAAGKFDSKMQMTGIVIEVPSREDLRVLRRAASDPRQLPLTPMDEILQSYRVNDGTRRVRTRGSVTWYEPGSSLVLQNGVRSLWVSTLYEGPLQIGEVVDATGFADVRGGYLTLTRAQVQGTGVQSPVGARQAGGEELARGGLAFDLVSTEGRVLAAVRGAAQDEYFLDAGGHLFSAVYRHPDRAKLPPMKEVEAGTRVRVSGICTMEYGSDPLGRPVAFSVLLRSFDDVEVLVRPPWLNVRHLLMLMGLLLPVLAAAECRAWLLERRMRRQAAALAALTEAEAEAERRRGQILEKINTRAPLAEVAGEITSLASYVLRGAPCWCELADGSRYGCSAGSDGGSIVRREIPAHGGAVHGSLLARVTDTAAGDSQTYDALGRAASLIALAIETRGLYSDLMHRSEFDLLTEVHNRFSLDRRMGELVREASCAQRQFGFIYVDLDDFKKVNDECGHLAGDVYLQLVAARMKRQLRPGDLLARLGGDEFGVLVTQVPGRSQVEEIALRIERCFDEPFQVEYHQLRGSASVGISLYPEDGVTQEELLRAADGAMYESKNRRGRCRDRRPEAALSAERN